MARGHKDYWQFDEFGRLLSTVKKEGEMPKLTEPTTTEPDTLNSTGVLDELTKMNDKYSCEICSKETVFLIRFFYSILKICPFLNSIFLEFFFNLIFKI